MQNKKLSVLIFAQTLRNKPLPGIKPKRIEPYVMEPSVHGHGGFFREEKRVRLLFVENP